jgi:hypothetical protein
MKKRPDIPVLGFDPRPPVDWALRFAVAFIAAVFGIALLLSVMVSRAQAHDALPTATKPLGWSYPFSCCSSADCRMVSSSYSSSPVRVLETDKGYAFSTSTEVIPYNDRRIKESPDGEFHWCSVQGKDDGRTLCLYVPPRAF